MIENSISLKTQAHPAIYSSIKSLNKIDENHESASPKVQKSIDTIITTLKQQQQQQQYQSNKKLSGSYSDLNKSKDYQQYYENDDVFYTQNVVPPPMPFSYINNKPYSKPTTTTHSSRSPTLTNSVTLSEVSGID
jgi:hypothetical protein